MVNKLEHSGESSSNKLNNPYNMMLLGNIIKNKKGIRQWAKLQDLGEVGLSLLFLGINKVLSYS